MYINTCVQGMYIHRPGDFIVFTSTVTTKRIDSLSNGDSSMVDPSWATLQVHGPPLHPSRDPHFFLTIANLLSKIVLMHLIQNIVIPRPVSSLYTTDMPTN